MRPSPIIQKLVAVPWIFAFSHIHKFLCCRAAAQTCCAMLGAPGGLFLDVKSAYSTAAGLQLFVAALAGIGVHVKV